MHMTFFVSDRVQSELSTNAEVIRESDQALLHFEVELRGVLLRALVIIARFFRIGW